MKLMGAAASTARCMRTLRVLQGYLDGALDEGTARRVAKHLGACRRCGLEAEVYREIKAALGEQGRPLDPRAVERLRLFGEQLAGSDHGD